MQVNRHMERLCMSNSPSMQKMVDWVLNARGKQIRPILTLLCSRLKGKKVDATEVAAIIEICHTASLIHDDIIDDADMRRGQLSVQKKFGREMAVYCGDFMIFAALGRTDLRLKPWYRAMFSRLEIMCDGEIGQYDNQYNTDMIHNDFGSGYYTLPAIHTFMDPVYGKKLALLAGKLKNGTGDETTDTRISELIRAAGGYDYTLKRMEHFRNLAKESLEIFGDSVARRKLTELVDYLWESANALRIE